MAPTIIIALVLKALLMAMPMAVALLAFKRMVQSQSANVWIYGATALVALVSIFGVLPWSIGLAEPASLFLLLSALTPMLWTGVVFICDRGRTNTYDVKDLAEDRASPLVLTDPQLPAPPLFRHSKPEPVIHAVSLAPARPLSATAEKVDETVGAGQARSVLAIARDMRGGTGSDSHAPSPRRRRDTQMDVSDLPFLARLPG